MASLGEPRKWVSFKEWLEQQCGGETAVSETGTALSEDGDAATEALSSNLTQPAAARDALASPSAHDSDLLASSSCDHSAEPDTSSSSSSSSSNTSAVQAAQSSSLAGPAPPAPLPRQPLRALLSDCRSEMRMASESSRARQEALVLLAAPGMPLHRAPVLTARQAQALLSAVSEPLVSLNVGRLTRRLASPTKLEPTDARGQLSLWLLPSDDLVLIWQCTSHAPASQPLPSAAAAAAGGPGSAAAGHPAAAVAASSSSAGLEGLEVQREAYSVTVSEELAHFPALCHLAEDAPLVTIHMLRGDTSGRSFYIRVRDDVAAANIESALHTVPSAAQASGASSPTSSSPASGISFSASEHTAPRMYFWLADADVTKALCALGRLKSLLKRPPTLARRSGVPERQLAQVAAWLHDIEAHQRQQAEAPAAAAATPEDADQHSGTCSPQVSPGCVPAVSPGLLLGKQRSPALVAGGLRALLSAAGHATQPAAVPTPGQQLQAPLATGGQAGRAAHQEAGELQTAASASATALAVYQDTAFFGGSIVVPVNMSVTVTVALGARGSESQSALLAAEACARAKRLAEAQTRAAVDVSGRQQVECRLAEAMVHKARQQRHRARQARHEARRLDVRRAQAQQTIALLREAEARTAESRAGGSTAGTLTTVAAAVPSGGPAPSTEAQPVVCSVPPAFEASAASICSGTSAAKTAQPSRGESFASLAAVDASVCSEVRQASQQPPATPCTPSPTRSGSHVTIDNLASVLERTQIDSAAGPSPPPPVDADRRAGSGSRVGVADLTDLLNQVD